MITKREVGPIEVDSEGVVVKRSKMVLTFDTGTRITIIPPDPYPSKLQQKRILDDLFAVEVAAARRISKTA